MTPKVSKKETFASVFRSPDPRPAYHQSPAFIQSVKGVKNAARLGVTNIGSLTQMGGEFVLLPGYKCAYAHRMANKFDHALAPDVLRAAGVQFPERGAGALPQDTRFTEEELAQLRQQENEVVEWKRELSISAKEARMQLAQATKETE